MFLRQTVTVLCTTLFLIHASAQTPMNKYDRAWKKIDSLISKAGLTQSALAEVNKIYTMAKAEKKDAQLIKALLYRIGLNEIKEEESTVKNIQQLEKELPATTEPGRSILNSILAEVYWNYFQEERYELYDRTETINFKKTDISTWSADDFHKRISQLYLASIKNEKQLQQTKLEAFDAIIFKGNVRHLRPTLFDLLAHRALDYFRNDERDISKPAYAFEIDNASAFVPAADFVKLKFPTKDSLSLHNKTLLLYQRLIAFHLNDKKPDALIDADINRLEFVHQHAILENKDSLFQMAVNHIANQYGTYPAAAVAWYHLAHSYYASAEEGKGADGYEKARTILEKIIVQKDSSEGKINAQNLLKQLLQQHLQLEGEKVNLPDQPFRMLVNYRNTAQVHFRIIKLDKKTKDSIKVNNSWQDEFWQSLMHLPTVKTYAQPLPATKDYLQHRVEVKLEALPVGEYAVLASIDKEFQLKNNVLAVQFFHISAIASLNNGSNFFVVNRETGNPLSRASVQVWYQIYNYQKQKYEARKGENLFTDKNGYFSISSPQASTAYGYRLELTHENDRLLLDDANMYNYSSNEEPAEKVIHTSFLFIDRSIYRPGQTAYFKGIVVSRNNKTNTSRIEAGKKTTIYLFDANGQKVDSIDLTTNEFGSYSGKFTLPQNQLNGYFRIEDGTTHGSAGFSVEEYKRPKFSVEIIKPSGTYKINDSIKVTGTVKAYAGNNIDGALVIYRVVRKIRWPIWFDYYRPGKIWPPYSREEQEIAHGETKTDSKGEFTINFKAIPDAAIDKKDQPTFYYEVSTDITDINGETRSGTTSVAVAYQAIQLTIITPDELPADSLKKLLIRSANFNDIYEKTTVTVTIHKLKQPNRIFRERYWEQPDQFLMTEEEYHKLFPYDIYKDENLVANWEKSSKTLEKTDTTNINGSFTINNSLFTPGWYLIEVTSKDKYGETVKAVKTIQLTGNVNTSPIAFGSITTDKDDYEPGEKATYTLKTNWDSVWVIHHLTRNTNDPEQQLLMLSAAGKSFKTLISENDRGGLALDMAFVKHNRVYTDNVTLRVPYTNKQLTVSFETFRDKTLPGSEEKWKVKISGYKTDKVMAEMMTAMYDASLDQFQPHNWRMPVIWSKSAYPQLFRGDKGFSKGESDTKTFKKDEYEIERKEYDHLIMNIMIVHNDDGSVRGVSPIWDYQRQKYGEAKKIMVPDWAADPDGSKGLMKDDVAGIAGRAPGVEVVQYAHVEIGKDVDIAGNRDNEKSKEQVPPIQIRRNFNETAFFIPDLKTDSAGNIEFSFTMPEALTQWKWMSLAHTKELAFGYSEKTIVTQKDLMVQPNAPRFMREGDRIDFTTKIVNLTDKELTGQVELQMIDPTTNQSVDGWFRNFFPNQYFTVPAKQSVPASFTIEIPFQYNKPVIYRLIARSGNISDGEEMMLPVVGNRMLVTESLPLNMRGNGTKQFKFEKLLQSGNSESLNHQALTIEFTSNPAWYAVQALPFLMEYPYECAEQTFNKFYANALATRLANSSSKLKAIFDKWKTVDTAALLSNLNKNPELKSVLLQETPWVFQANSETQQKKNIALLFDMVRMSREMEGSLSKLSAMQVENGGFVWFTGGRDDRYITQYILTGIGHLKKLNALPSNNSKLNLIIIKAISYLDNKIKEDYDLLIKNKANLSLQQLGTYEIQYLYMRSFFANINIPGETFKAYNFYRKQAQQFWIKQSRYMQGMIALSLHRTGDVQTAKNILKSLQQNALFSEEMGMYWKEFNTGGYYWYQSPIESHALLTEAFSEINKDNKITDDLKTWLLKQKQTQNWRTTKATADACYVLLLEGTNWLANEPIVEISLGGTPLSARRGAGGEAEAGTGYFKKVIEGPKVDARIGNISVKVTSPSPQEERPGVRWGAAYWQYFEDLDKITPSSTPLKIVKKLFVEKNTDRGPVLQPLKEGDALQIGDKVKVRIELRVDRTLEYVHMKDMRAASLEPVNVISQYKWQGGLGYYESTKDASTNFFFGYLPKGTWVFEYPLFVTHTGTFSNGVTTIQCMYAPEFTSHSEGIKFRVE